MIFQKAQKNNLVGVVGALTEAELEEVIGGATYIDPKTGKTITLKTPTTSTTTSKTTSTKKTCVCSYPYKQVGTVCSDGKGNTKPCA